MTKAWVKKSMVVILPCLGMSQVICGNPVRALRARKQQGLSSQSAVMAGMPSHLTSSPDQQDELIAQFALRFVSSSVMKTNMTMVAVLFLKISQ